MKNWVKRMVATCSLSGCVAAGAIGCADNESTIFIRQVVVPSTECSYSADPGQDAFLLGTMDLAFTPEYWAGLLIGNQLVERGAEDRLRTETSRFRAEGAEVQIETTDGGVIQEFSVPVSGFADPASGTSPGWGVVAAVLIDSSTASSLAANFPTGVRSDLVGRVVAVVKVYGTTLGGQELESGEFRFPISICYGCLVSFPPDATDPAQGVPNCLNVADSTGVEVPCQLGQDSPVDCRLCKSIGFGGVCDP